MFKSIFRFLFSKKLSVQQKNNIEYVRGIILDDIKKTSLQSEKVKAKLPKEVLMAVVYLEIFASYLQEKKFRNLKEAWTFLNDIKGIIEKVFYVDNYIARVKESMEANGIKEKSITKKPDLKAENLDGITNLTAKKLSPDPDLTTLL